MGFRYVYYDANGNGPWAIETDTVEDARALVLSGIGYDAKGQPYDQTAPDDVIVDTDKGDTVGTGDAPAGVLLPGDSAYSGPDPDDAPADALPSQVGSQDVAGANSVGVQDPAVAAHDPAGSPVTPTPTVPAGDGTDGSTPAYDATQASTGVTPSGPTPAPSASASADGGSSSDGSPSPAPATSDAAAADDSSDGPVVPGETPVQPLGDPVTADSTAELPPTSEEAQAAPEEAQPADPAAPTVGVEDDTDAGDDLGSFDTPAQTEPAGVGAQPPIPTA